MILKKSRHLAIFFVCSLVSLSFGNGAQEILFVDSPPLNWCSTESPLSKDSFGGYSFERLDAIMSASGLTEGTDYVFRCEPDIQSAKSRLLSSSSQDVFFIFNQWILHEDLQDFQFAHFTQDSISLIRKGEDKADPFVYVFTGPLWCFLFILPFFFG